MVDDTLILRKLSELEVYYDQIMEYEKLKDRSWEIEKL